VPHPVARRLAPLALVATLACDRQPPARGPAFADPRDSVAALARATFAGLPPFPCSSTEQDLAVTAEGVGLVRVGARAADVGRRCPSTDTVVVQVVDSAPAPAPAGAPPVAPAGTPPGAAPGTAPPTARPQVRPPERTLLVSLGGGVLLALVAPTDTITRVVVPTPAFRTRGGVGVGSTVAELRRAYDRLCGTIDEGWVVLHAPQLPGVAFATSADYGEAVQRKAELQPRAAAVPDSAHVVQLWAYGAGAGPCAAP
jgi:hypothetical protein